MDVERAERDTLKTAFEDQSLLHIKQLAIEYHITISKIKMIEVLTRLETIGFRKYYVHLNPLCAKFYEIYIINKGFLK
jgi:hypothetical protein